MHVRKLLASTLVVTSLVSSATARADEVEPTPTSSSWRENYAYSLGIQAYVYGFPLVYLTELRHKWATDKASHPYTMPNHLYHFRTVADDTYKDGGSPNTDTLYSWGFMDLSKEPVVISHPDMGDRYFAFEMADMYSDNFGYIGKRTTGSQAGAFLVAGPNWHGVKPDDVKDVIASPTPSALVFGRTFVSGPDDTAAGTALQDQFRVVPLSQWGRKDAVLPDNHDVPVPFDRATDPLADFRTINQAMDENPPREREKIMLEQFAQIGIGQGQSAAFDNLDEATKQGLARAAVDGRKIVQEMVVEGVTASRINGWLYPSPDFGRQGLKDDFRGRSICALGGIICNDAAEAVYIAAFTDVRGKLLDGALKYTLHFEKGQLPPVNEFWSVTMYGPEYNLVPNPINRFAIRDRTPGIKQDADGSTTFYLQSTSPGQDKESNWLPTPQKGRFSMLLRAYVPKAPILDRTWTPPTVAIAEQ